MIRIMFFLISLLASTTALAGNFSITPLAPVPTAIRPGDTVPIYFSVKNMTKSTRSGYVLSQLPANVQQSSSSALYTNSVCSSPLSLPAGGDCTLVFNITGPVSFNFSLCHGASCTTSSASVALAATQATDWTFPYGTAPSGDVCEPDTTGYATPETMLGSWAMLKAVEMDVASHQLPTMLNSSNVVYAVGTAAVGNYYGYGDCGGGCDSLNGYCFAMKFNTKTSPQYMIFQSVNVGANVNSFDIYMSGGGVGVFPPTKCETFWGTGPSVDWAQHLGDPGTTCDSYFHNFNDINSQYSVTYNGTAYPAEKTLIDACAFATTSGFSGGNFSDITIVPVTCPTALTQVTGLALASTTTTIGTNGGVKQLIPIAKLEASSFTSGTAIPGLVSTQMQDCQTPSSGYCDKGTSTITNYQASISASLTAPLTEPAPNPYCPLNPTAAGFCSTDGCATATNPSSIDYCNQGSGNCLDCDFADQQQWCDCPG